jgi:hypothetical protein
VGGNLSLATYDFMWYYTNFYIHQGARP